MNVKQYLASIGRKGGKAKTSAKSAASIANGKLGGRPKKPKRAARLPNKGCGKPIRVIGTNGGTMACGATLRHGKELAVHYCSDCEHRMRQAAIDAALDDAPAQAGGHTPILLYHHKTDGGAEYLTDKFVECPNGHKEGVFEGASYIVVHQEHKPITLSPGIWEVGRVQEYDYFQKMVRKVQD